MSDPIFAPFFAMILLTLVVWVYMYARRIPFIRRSALRDDQLTPAELARISPPAVANPSDNLKNLFEISDRLLCARAFSARHAVRRLRVSGGGLGIRRLPGAA